MENELTPQSDDEHHDQSASEGDTRVRCQNLEYPAVHIRLQFGGRVQVLL